MNVCLLYKKKRQPKKRKVKKSRSGPCSIKTLLNSSSAASFHSFNTRISVTVNGVYSKPLSQCERLCRSHSEICHCTPRCFETNTKIPLGEENNGAGATSFSRSLLCKTDTVPATNVWAPIHATRCQLVCLISLCRKFVFADKAHNKMQNATNFAY